jgi:hypothetical protein
MGGKAVGTLDKSANVKFVFATFPKGECFAAVPMIDFPYC